MGEDRITKLEINVATLAVDMKHVVSMIEELKALVTTMTKLETICAACMARQDERWRGHSSIHEQVATVDDLARIADRVASNKIFSNGTASDLKGTNEQMVLARISIAKLVASGAGGGAAVYGLVELLKFLST